MKILELSFLFLTLYLKVDLKQIIKQIFIKTN